MLGQTRPSAPRLTAEQSRLDNVPHVCRGLDPWFGAARARGRVLVEKEVVGSVVLLMVVIAAGPRTIGHQGRRLARAAMAVGCISSAFIHGGSPAHRIPEAGGQRWSFEESHNQSAKVAYRWEVVVMLIWV